MEARAYVQRRASIASYLDLHDEPKDILTHIERRTLDNITNNGATILIGSKIVDRSASVEKSKKSIESHPKIQTPSAILDKIE